ncbi:hypothetical protein [Bradyrhizobium quebecense]|uniref:Uncharacterized protein n=1 Tax=Bradyrhizobium quebecense TaxID=2748629 RepID=A0ACD3V8Z0_9BRAD|nr:hypothetical protein [Bradyrhizobium quebecense]UGA47061.1 hypothetical protein HU230_0013860 [Bradyrhizobium quebecense]UGY02906.1 hypothetical protein J4P68_0038545 [Bradyrhizobium quebecense]
MKVLLGYRVGKAQARPKPRRGGAGTWRFRDHIAAVEQSLDGFIDLVGRKLSPELVRELGDAASICTDCRRQRAIELAMEKELSIFGIEADNIRRQHVGREIRCELQNVVVGALGGFAWQRVSFLCSLWVDH